MCRLCGTVRETLDHLSLWCLFAHAIWVGVITRIGLPPDIRLSETAVIEDWWPAATARVLPSQIGKQPTL
jgi:hypothetical protein